MDQEFMDKAVQLAIDNVAENAKPFGALIVKEGRILASGVNESLEENDPIAHAEIQAIRLASQKWGEETLIGATMYASGHPCPMCLAAMHLTGFEKIYYHSTLEETEASSLDVKPVYEELRKPFSQQSIPLVKMNSTISRNPIREWLTK